eukprot:scaffold6021_cov117-Isochrysis_galbana.AAC.9
MCFSSREGETPKVETCTMTCRPPYSTPRKPPRWNSWSRPSSRLQHAKKLRVYSKSRKPIRSEFSMARSSSSRTAMDRKSSEDGKGACRKSPMCAVRCRRKIKEGSRSNGVGAPFGLREGVLGVGHAQLVVEDRPQVAPAEAMVVVGDKLLVKEDGNARRNAAHPHVADAEGERLAVEHRLLVPLDAPAASFCPGHLEREVVGDQDHRVRCFQWRHLDYRVRAAARVLRGRQLQKSTEQGRQRRSGQHGHHVRQVLCEGRPPLSDDLPGKSVQQVGPHGKVVRQPGDVTAKALVERAKLAIAALGRIGLPLVCGHNAVAGVRAARLVKQRVGMIDGELKRA